MTINFTGKSYNIRRTATKYPSHIHPTNRQATIIKNYKKDNAININKKYNNDIYTFEIELTNSNKNIAKNSLKKYIEHLEVEKKLDYIG